jgi:hypothetical protein
MDLSNAQVQLQASQIKAAGAARANPKIACQLQRPLESRTAIAAMVRRVCHEGRKQGANPEQRDSESRQEP